MDMEDFVRIKKEIDKTKVKKSIEELEAMGLAHLEEKKSLSVR
jgi:hypothetical protein